MAVGTSSDMNYSILKGLAPQNASIDKLRRLYNFSDKIAEIEPMQSAFFSYLAKLRKVNTDDPTFKFLEQRHQWQRRNFFNGTAVSSHALSGDATVSITAASCYYDRFGRPSTSACAPYFLLANQRIGLKATDDSDGAEVILVGYITAAPTVSSTSTAFTFEVTSVQKGASLTNASGGVIAGYTVTIAAGAEGQVIGSAFAEGTGAPQGWSDELYDRDGYTQIFKTACPMFTGTAMATRYRGRPNEFLRVWKEKLKEHKADLVNAALFGVGKAGSGTSSTPSYTWGVLPYIELYGNRYALSYDGSTYDTWLDHMESFFAPENGNSGSKLVLASRKIINWLNKLDKNEGFLGNTIQGGNFDLDIQKIKGRFGHKVTSVSTIWGDLHFVEEPNLRGWMKDYAVAIDLKNVAYRPLVGNGISRDTFIKTNIQDNDSDGRKDMITTEMGIQIDLPETHAVFKFS